MRNRFGKLLALVLVVGLWQDGQCLVVMAVKK